MKAAMNAGAAAMTIALDRLADNKVSAAEPCMC
jgi:hypothetical protein